MFRKANPMLALVVAHCEAAVLNTQADLNRSFYDSHGVTR